MKQKNVVGQSVENIFCKLSAIDSEADVEALFIERLFTKLHYPDDRVH